MADVHAWSQIVAFYRELIEHGWRQEPMLELVSWMAAGPHSRFLSPCTSHEALGLSRVASGWPMVYIVFSEPLGFVIHWQRQQGYTVREEAVLSPQAPEVFERILDWLDAAELRQAE